MMNTVPILKKFNLEQAPLGKVSKFLFHIVDNGLGFPVYLPVIVARGQNPGKVLGFTAAVHGNELNGIKVIHRLVKELEDEIDQLQGTIVAVPVVNAFGALTSERVFNNGTDLNRIMPGKPKGNSSDQYANRFIRQIVTKLDYLVDLHTASFGRINSLYVRVDLDDPDAKKMAMLQHPQIIVHNKGKDGSLRGAAGKLGIPSITVEVGDPQRFQKKLIRESVVGINNILSFLKMLPMEERHPEKAPVICDKSFWVYTDHGGLLETHPGLTDEVEKGEKIATLYDLFGTRIKHYYAPNSGVVIGKSVNPISQTGARIIHLGIPVA